MQPLSGLETVFAQQAEGLPDGGILTTWSKTHTSTAGFEKNCDVQSHILISLPDVICATQPVCQGPGAEMAAPSGITIPAPSPAPSSRLQFGTEPTEHSQNVLRGCGSYRQIFLAALAA